MKKLLLVLVAMLMFTPFIGTAMMVPSQRMYVKKLVAVGAITTGEYKEIVKRTIYFSSGHYDGFYKWLNVGGVDITWSWKIGISKSLKKSFEVEHIIWHEIGHYMWAHKERDRSGYPTTWYLPWTYGADIVEEAYAEVFASVARDVIRFNWEVEYTDKRRNKTRKLFSIK